MTSNTVAQYRVEIRCLEAAITAFRPCGAALWPGGGRVNSSNGVAHAASGAAESVLEAGLVTCGLCGQDSGES